MENKILKFKFIDTYINHVFFFIFFFAVPLLLNNMQNYKSRTRVISKQPCFRAETV